MVSTEDKVYRCTIILNGTSCKYNTTSPHGLGGHMSGHYHRGEAVKPTVKKIKVTLQPTSNERVDLEEFSKMLYDIVNELATLRVDRGAESGN